SGAAAGACSTARGAGAMGRYRGATIAIAGGFDTGLARRWSRRRARGADSRLWRDRDRAGLSKARGRRYARIGERSKEQSGAAILTARIGPHRQQQQAERPSRGDTARGCRAQFEGALTREASTSRSRLQRIAA